MNESKQRLGHSAVVFVYNTLCKFGMLHNYH